MKISKYYISQANTHSLAELLMVEYSDREIYYNYREVATSNNAFLETIHTPGGKLSAASITFSDGSELIITKEIVAVVKAPLRTRRR